MRCPFCGCENTQVKDSRPTEENAAIRRRRVCPDCGGRFTTFERVQLRELIVVKRSGRKVPFDRDKLVNSVTVALRKRPIDAERIERMVSGIVRQLESLRRKRDRLLASSANWSWRRLRGLDPVAYVRFASVYRDFREAADFQRCWARSRAIRSHPQMRRPWPKPGTMTPRGGPHAESSAPQGSQASSRSPQCVRRGVCRSGPSPQTIDTPITKRLAATVRTRSRGPRRHEASGFDRT